jgi:dihydroflavonol-4-reductase
MTTSIPSDAPVLVTGGCGFVGRHLVRALSERGERVRVLDLADPAPLAADVQHVRGSILSEADVRSAMTGVRRVYHLAAIAHLWRRDKGDFARVNTEGTRVVLACARTMPIERMIYCSTESILLPKPHRRNGPIDGSSPPPLEDMPGPYTRSKHLAERAALEAVAAGLDVVIVNPTVPIGPGDDNMTPPAAMIDMFLKGRSPAYLDCVLNLVDVRDVAAGIVLAGDRGRPGVRYILGGENLRLSEFLRLLEEVSGRRMPKRAIPAPVALAAAVVSEWIADRITGRTPAANLEGVRLALRSTPFNSRRAREELGYAPKPIREALAASVLWLSAPSGDGRPFEASAAPAEV